MQEALMQIGDLICDRFQLTAHLGTGGKATVFIASDKKLKTDVAVKVFLKSAVPNDKAKFELLERCRQLSLLPQDMCAQIYDFGEENGSIYLAMELLKGCTLNEFHKNQDDMKDQPSTRRFLDKLVWALYNIEEQVSARNMYWELHPDNIFIQANCAIKLLGLPDTLDSKSGHPVSLSAAPYLPPEHNADVAVGPESIQYTIASICVFALVGANHTTNKKNLESLLKGLAGRNKARVLAKALRADPKRRYKDTITFAARGFGRRPGDSFILFTLFGSAKKSLASLTIAILLAFVVVSNWQYLRISATALFSSDSIEAEVIELYDNIMSSAAAIRFEQSRYQGRGLETVLDPARNPTVLGVIENGVGGAKAIADILSQADNARLLIESGLGATGLIQQLQFRSARLERLETWFYLVPAFLDQQSVNGVLYDEWSRLRDFYNIVEISTHIELVKLRQQSQESIDRGDIVGALSSEVQFYRLNYDTLLELRALLAYREEMAAKVERLGDSELTQRLEDADAALRAGEWTLARQAYAALFGT
jgi:Protein kinase domain